MQAVTRTGTVTRIHRRRLASEACHGRSALSL